MVMQNQRDKEENKEERLLCLVNEGAPQVLIAATDFPLDYSTLKVEPPIYAYLTTDETNGTIYVANCSHSLPIVFDTGCSMSVSPKREDFVADLKKPVTHLRRGLKGKVKVLGMGKVNWTVFDVHGITRTVRTRAYYIPEGKILAGFSGLLLQSPATGILDFFRNFPRIPEFFRTGKTNYGKIRLFSPQTYFQENDRGSGKITK
jgi:hypothetical protein